MLRNRNGPSDGVYEKIELKVSVWFSIAFSLNEFIVKEIDLDIKYQIHILVSDILLLYEMTNCNVFIN